MCLSFHFGVLFEVNYWLARIYIFINEILRQSVQSEFHIMSSLTDKKDLIKVNSSIVMNNS